MTVIEPATVDWTEKDDFDIVRYASADSIPEAIDEAIRRRLMVRGGPLPANPTDAWLPTGKVVGDGWVELGPPAAS